MDKVSEHATDGLSMGKRSLKNICLSYLACSGQNAILSTVYKQATMSKNMTDTVAALYILMDIKHSYKNRSLKNFEMRWHKVPTVMDKWFSVQASEKSPKVVKKIRTLMRHKAFDIKNPNRVSSLIGSFASNGLAFHADDGSGYSFVAKMIVRLDPINAHSAAALAKCFARWRDYETKQQKLMQKQLKFLAKQKNLSRNVSEIIERSLAKQ
jgi:aminopeptidase N